MGIGEPIEPLLLPSRSLCLPLQSRARSERQQRVLRIYRTNDGASRSMFLIRIRYDQTTAYLYMVGAGEATVAGPGIILEEPFALRGISS